MTEEEEHGWISNDDVRKTFFANSWPEMEASFDGFDVDDDGWNIHDHHLCEWYANRNPKRTTMSMASQESRFDDSEWPSFVVDPCSLSREGPPSSPPRIKSSPVAKLRANLPKLLCRPYGIPAAEDEVALLSSSLSPLGARRRLAVIDTTTVLEERKEGERKEGEKEATTECDTPSSMYNAALLTNGRKLTIHCGDTQPKKLFSRDSHYEEDSNSSCKAMGCKGVSSIVGCQEIDPKLLEIFNSMKSEVETRDGGDQATGRISLQLESESVRGMVADRRRWLQDAFKSDSASTSDSSSTDDKASAVSSVVSKFGGKYRRRQTAVMKKKEEWEQRCAEGSSTNGNKTARIIWETRVDGSYRKKVVVGVPTE